jgi:hypothetical protein
MQSNQDIVKTSDSNSILNIIDADIWENIIAMMLKRENAEHIKNYIHTISIEYNIDKKNIIKDFLNYIIHKHSKYVNKDFFNFIENLMHSQIQNNNIHIFYSLSRLSSFIQI